MDKKSLFTSKIEKIYPNLSKEIIEELTKPRHTTFREVILKAGDCSKELNEYSKGPFSNTYYTTNAQNLMASPCYKSEKIYIQGFASMLPALVLKAEPGQAVLDLCAAPGSKSSQLANLTNDSVHITCVDNNSARLFALKDNLTRQNIHNYEMLKADAGSIQTIPTMWEKYDRVMADVPCSNEGNIRLYNEENLTKWNPKLAKKIPNLQKRIISSAIKSLKQGGRLVYSTCTFSVDENEEVVDWALHHFPEMTLESIKLPLDNVVPGFTEYGKKHFSSSLSNCLRILPTNLFDGFFLASLLKL